MMTRFLRIMMILSTALLLIATVAQAQSKMERLKKAVLEETDEVYGAEIEDTTEREWQRVLRNIMDLVQELMRGQNARAADHILSEWGEDGFGDDDHVHQCPICYNVAEQVGQDTDLVHSLGSLEIPVYWNIGGLAYGRDDQGRLYPVNPRTGQAIGAAQGWLWATENGYFGVSSWDGQAYPATPIQ